METGREEGTKEEGEGENVCVESLQIEKFVPSLWLCLMGLELGLYDGLYGGSQLRMTLTRLKVAILNTILERGFILSSLTPGPKREQTIADKGFAIGFRAFDSDLKTFVKLAEVLKSQMMSLLQLLSMTSSPKLGINLFPLGVPKSNSLRFSDGNIA